MERSASRLSGRLELDRSSSVSRNSQSKRSSSAAPVKASAFLSPQRKKSALDFDLTPTRNIAPASPSHAGPVGETFVKVFALLCQHEDKKQQEAVVAKASDSTVVMRTSYADNSVYQFTNVFTPPHQCEVVFQPLLPVVLDCINGINGAIVAYGQRGLDKPVLEGSTTDPGIIPRALNELFALRRRLGLAMSCCMFEVCGDKIIDLITPSALEAADIRPDFVRTSSLERQDVQEVLLYHRHHTFTLLHHAMRQRKQRHTTDGTERGHFITVVRVERPNQSKRGLLYLVDLCGMADVSEGTEKAVAFKEGLSTNSDVHHFERMVMSRASGEGFIPSKSCLLTRVLVDACGGNSKTALLVFISPRQEDKKVTMHAVQFAQSARSIMSHVKPNAIVPHEALKDVFLPMSLPSSPSRRSVMDDSGSVAVGKDGDHPRVSQWLNLKPSANSAQVVQALADAASGVRKPFRQLETPSEAVGSPFISPFSPLSGTVISEAPPSSVKELQAESALLSRLLEEEKWQNRANHERLQQTSYDAKRLHAENASLQKLLQESLQQLEARKRAVDDAMGVVTSLKFELIATKDTLEAKETECATLKETLSSERTKAIDDNHRKDVLIGDLQHRADALRNQLELSQTALESAQTMRLDVQSRLEDAMRELQRERDANQGVIVSERTLQGKVQQLQSQVEDLSAKLKAAEGAKAAEQRHAITEKHKVAAVEAEVNRLQEELALIKTQAKSLSAQLQDQQMVLVDVRRRHRDELAGLEKLLEEERDRVRECEADLDKAAAEAVQRGLQTKSATADADSKQAIIQELEQRLAAMRQDLEKGAKRIMALDKLKAEADGKIAALTDRVSSNEKELQAARSELQQAHHKTHKCEAVIAMLRSEVDALKKASVVATKDRTDIETELSTCWAARTTAESKVTQLQAEIDVLKQRNEASEAELEIAHAKLQDQLAALDSLRREAEFNCENATLFRTEQERCMALSAELHDLQAAKVQELTEATELNAELSTALQTEREKVASLKSLLNTLKQDTDQLAKEKADIEVKANELEEKLAAGTANSANLEADITALKRSVTECVGKVVMAANTSLARFHLPATFEAEGRFNVDNLPVVTAALVSSYDKLVDLTVKSTALNDATTQQVGVLRDEAAALQRQLSTVQANFAAQAQQLTAAQFELESLSHRHNAAVVGAGSIHDKLRQCLSGRGSASSDVVYRGCGEGSLDDALTSLTELADQLTGDEDAKQAELAALFDSNSEQAARLAQLQEQLTIVSGEKNALSFELERLNVRCQSLEEVKQELEEQLGRATKAAEESRREAREGNTALRLQKAAMLSLEADKTALESQVQSLESNLAQIEAKALEAERVLGRTSKELVNERAAVDNLRRKLSETDAKLLEVQTKPPLNRTQPLSRRNSSTDSTAALKAELDRLKAEHSECDGIIERLESQLQDSMLEVGQSRDKLAALESALASRNAQIEDLTSELTRFELESSERADEAQRHSVSAFAFAEAWKAKADALNGEVTRLKAEIRALRTDTDVVLPVSTGDASKRVKELTDTLAKQRSQLSLCESAIASACARLTGAVGAPLFGHGDLATAVDGILLALTESRTQLDEARARVIEVEVLSQRGQASIATLTKRVEAAESEKEAAENLLEEVTASLHAAEASMRSIKTVVEEEDRARGQALVAAQARADDAELQLKQATVKLKAASEALVDERERAVKLEAAHEAVSLRLQQLRSDAGGSIGAIASLEAQLSSAKHVCDTLIAEKEAMRQSQLECASAMAMVQSSFDASQLKVDQLSCQLVAKDRELAILQASVSELEDRVGNLTAQVSESHVTVAAAGETEKSAANSVAVANAKLGAALSEAEILRGQVKDVTQALREVTETKNGLQRRVSELEAALSNADLQVSTLKSIERRAASDLEASRSKVLELTEMLGQSELEVHRLQAAVVSSELTLESERRHWSSGDTAVQEWKAKVEQLQQELHSKSQYEIELRNDFASLQAERDAIEVQLRCQQSSHKQIEARLADAQRNYRDMDAEHAKVVEKCNQLVRSVEDAEDNCVAAARKAESACRDRDEALRRVEAAENKANAASNQIVSLQRELGQVTADFESQLAQCRQQAEETRVERENVISDLKRKLADVEHASHDAAAIANHVKAQLTFEQTKCERMKLEAEQLQLELQDAKIAADPERQRKVTADYEARLSALQQEAKSLSTRLEASLHSQAVAEARVSDLTLALNRANGGVESVPMTEDERTQAQATHELLLEAQAELEATLHALNDAKDQMTAAESAHQAELASLQASQRAAAKELDDLRSIVEAMTQQQDQSMDSLGGSGMMAPPQPKAPVKRGGSVRTLSSAASTSLYPQPPLAAQHPQQQGFSDVGHRQFQRTSSIDDSFPSIGVRNRSGLAWESSGIEPHEPSGCSHQSRRHGCAACAIGASVSALSEGLSTKNLSPMSAWKSQLHGPVAPPTRSSSFRKPKSAPSSPLLSESMRRLADDTMDEVRESGSTGIMGIEVLERDSDAPIQQQPSSFLQWSMHARR